MEGLALVLFVQGSYRIYLARPEFMASSGWWADDSGFVNLFVGTAIIALGAVML